MSKFERDARRGRLRLGEVMGLIRAALVTLALVSTICSAPVWAEERNGEGQSPRGVLSDFEQRVLRYTNHERQRKGLSPLRLSHALRFVARQHSENMCVCRRFEHESPLFPHGWRTFEARLGQIGIRDGGENIGYQTLLADRELWARNMVYAWMSSPRHRKNILDSRFRYLGVGFRYCGKRIGYVTQLFAREAGGNN